MGEQIKAIPDSIRTNHIEALKERKEPSLAEFNPLIYPPNLESGAVVAGLTQTINHMIDQYGGLQPSKIETFNVPTMQGDVPRFYVRFDLPALTEEQLSLIETIVEHIYGDGTRNRKTASGGKAEVIKHPGFGEKKSKVKDSNNSMLGWYMGKESGSVYHATQGVLVFRNVGSNAMSQFVRHRSPDEWFTFDDLKDPITHKRIGMKYTIEIREAAMYQTDIAKLATMISIVLAEKDLPHHADLLYTIYQYMNKMGIKKTSRNRISGMHDELSLINRVLVGPLANNEASRSIDLKPSSILLIGLPGTGKTLVAEHFLQEDTGVFFVPVDGLQLMREINQPPERRYLLSRISEIFHSSGIPVIIHIDDIEEFLQDNTTSQSTLLNLMAGVREQGFYVLASTNHPDRIDPRLLQPERFGHVIYFGLPDNEVRAEILGIHANAVSKELQLPLFDSEENREMILRFISDKTEGFTARYLAEICTQAKTFYLQRLAEAKQKNTGLKEKDLDIHFETQDWFSALSYVIQQYELKRKEYETWNDKLRDFVKSHQGVIGFVQETTLRTDVTIYQREFEAQQAAAQLKSSSS